MKKTVKKISEFDYGLDYKKINFRQKPHLYRVGRGEQSVLLVEPYKSEILPHWKFKTPAIAKKSADKIYVLYLQYKKTGDFIGMDMARKFIQMGYTRARRYANHAGGRKYKPGTSEVLPYKLDTVKAETAAVFYKVWGKIRIDRDYLAQKKPGRAARLQSRPGQQDRIFYFEEELFRAAKQNRL